MCADAPRWASMGEDGPVRPMLATKGERIPEGPDWVHEVKWDGVRMLCEVGSDGYVRLTTRNGNDATVAWPDVARVPLPGRGLLVDGEVIGLNDRGVPDFRAIQERMHVRSATTAARLAARVPATYMVFDLLRLDGEDLAGRPLAERRRVLEGLDLSAAGWQVPQVYEDGQMLWEATRSQQLEGVVSKRLSSRYEEGARSRSWLKFPHRERVSYVVGGWRPETGSTGRVGALLVGEPGEDGLHFRGRVGSGIAGKVGPMLKELLEPLAVGESPFVDEVPKVDALGTHWVRPRVVVDVESLGSRHYDRLRQPAYRGVRTDLTPEDL